MTSNFKPNRPLVGIHARFLAMVLGASATLASAQVTPVGTWHSIDDKTGQPRGEIRITEQGGMVSGRVVRSLAGGTPGEVCDQCTDDRKGQPKIGMDIIRGARKAEGADVWEGGTILDPDSGTVYKLKLTPVEGGKKLEVRGFVGFSLLGRTQTWLRVQ